MSVVESAREFAVQLEQLWIPNKMFGMSNKLQLSHLVAIQGLKSLKKSDGTCQSMISLV